MTKFKKLFLTVLTLLLGLGVLFPSTPAFALGNPTLPPATKRVLAIIKSMSVSESYPPRLKITGTLPSSCYQLKVSTQVAVPVSPAIKAGTLFVWVRGVAPTNILCAQGIKTFTTTVTLNPLKLRIPPGRYVALVNPVNGQSRFKTTFTVPKPETVTASITKVVMLNGLPSKFRISGTLPSTCYSLRISAPQVSGHVISIFLRGTAPAGLLCTLRLKPFSATVTLDPAKLKLAPGRYMVLFNPVNGASRFKAEVIVGVD